MRNEGRWTLSEKCRDPNKTIRLEIRAQLNKINQNRGPVIDLIYNEGSEGIRDSPAPKRRSAYQAGTSISITTQKRPFRHCSPPQILPKTISRTKKVRYRQAREFRSVRWGKKLISVCAGSMEQITTSNTNLLAEDAKYNKTVNAMTPHDKKKGTALSIEIETRETCITRWSRFSRPSCDPPSRRQGNPPYTDEVATKA